MARINWSTALADYLKDETASYASIAKKYGVSLQAVKKRAGKEGWQDLRRKSIQKVNQELPELIGESIADVNARHIRTGKILQAKGMIEIVQKGVSPRNADEARKFVETGINIERKAAGLDKQVTNVVVGVRFSSPEFRKEYEY